MNLRIHALPWDYSWCPVLALEHLCYSKNKNRRWLRKRYSSFQIVFYILIFECFYQEVSTLVGMTLTVGSVLCSQTKSFSSVCITKCGSLEDSIARSYWSLVSKDTGCGIGSSVQCGDGLLMEGTSGYCKVFILFWKPVDFHQAKATTSCMISRFTQCQEFQTNVFAVWPLYQVDITWHTAVCWIPVFVSISYIVTKIF